MKSQIDASVKAIVKQAFPAYKGRKISVENSGKIFLTPYWDGGSRSIYVAIDRATGNVAAYPATNPYSDKFANGSHAIPETVIIVEHAMFCGKDVGITVHLPANAALV